ncbi:hypothetical protein [Uliginosibacterium flavum]
MMLTMQDCLDYCDLTNDEVELFAEHQHIPDEVAAPLACSLVQTDEGVKLICSCLSDMVSDAMIHGAIEKAEHVLHVYAEFRSAHPLH